MNFLCEMIEIDKWIVKLAKCAEIAQDQNKTMCEEGQSKNDKSNDCSVAREMHGKLSFIWSILAISSLFHIKY